MDCGCIEVVPGSDGCLKSVGKSGMAGGLKRGCIGVGVKSSVLGACVGCALSGSGSCTIVGIISNGFMAWNSSGSAWRN